MSGGIQIRALSFHGPGKVPAVVKFGPGLNIVYGASNTGKSFIVETIDFMLGGKGPLPDIDERIGYDRILLAIEDVKTSTEFTLQRSHEGGAFKLFEGIATEELPEGDGEILGDTHSDRNADNLSTRLLERLGMAGARLRKNKNDDTINLSFRHLARLAIINEEEIIQKRSPLADGNYTADTANFSAFKYLLTGTDDSALVSLRKSTPEEMTREAQIELLDDLIKTYKKQVREIAGKPAELEEQDEKLGDALETKSQQLSLIEVTFKELSTKRRTYFKRIEEAENRLTEISTLLERFALLEKHYTSDLDRLRGMQEAGSLFIALGKSSCPICGALPDHQHADVGCDGDASMVVIAAAAEIEKIEERQTELVSTISVLKTEEIALQKRLLGVSSSLKNVSAEIKDIVAPDLRRQRATYTELSDKRLNVREAIGLYDSLADFEKRKAKLVDEDSDDGAKSNIGIGLPSSITDDFAATVQETLQAWQFPNSERVHFDLKLKDLVIGGKVRTSYGKGLRAITQAAFTVGLMRYCMKHDSGHPGFVALDSPLMSYKEPEDTDDDLSGTGLKDAFYADLAAASPDRQFIIIENVSPVAAIAQTDQATEFTGTPKSGRFGLFPI